MEKTKRQEYEENKLVTSLNESDKKKLRLRNKER